jgi:hypothetical protein
VLAKGWFEGEAPASGASRSLSKRQFGQHVARFHTPFVRISRRFKLLCQFKYCKAFLVWSPRLFTVKQTPFAGGGRARTYPWQRSFNSFLSSDLGQRQSNPTPRRFHSPRRQNCIFKRPVFHPPPLNSPSWP